MSYKDPEKKKLADKAYAERNREKIAAYQKIYRQTYSAEHREELRQNSRDWAKADPERAHKSSYNSYLKKNFGITIEEFEDLLKKQNYLCACCGRHKDSNVSDGHGKVRRLAVDHDHSTGKIRGLLCTYCNVGIGYLGDSAEGLNKALAYLNRNLASNFQE